MKIEKYFWISLVLHILLCGSFLSFHLFNQGNQSSNNQAVAAYAYHEPSSEKNYHAIHQSQPMQVRKQSSHALFSQKTKPEPNSVANVHHRKTEEQFLSTGANQNDILLKILHQAVFAKQTYPESALLLHQTGTVIIGMMIYPDGNITNAAILKSSGFKNIDAAALAAVQAISPIAAVQPYLNHPQSFSIDVVFASE